MGTNHYLVVSDLHLADIEDHADGWKRHKGRDGVFTGELVAMVDEHLDKVAAGDTFTLVLNGDIFDFDLVTALPTDGTLGTLSANERRYGLDATEVKSRWKLDLILDHHDVFLAALARLVSAGHKVVLIAGNHDRELCFDAVAERFVERVLAVAGSVDRSCVIVEPWFFHVPGEIYVEHGHQYEHYSSYQHNLDPTYEKTSRVRSGVDGGLSKERHLALSTGNLSNRYLLSNIGFFNPHATDFILSAGGYFMHWWRKYALTRRSLILTWFMGSLRALFALLSIRRAQRRAPPPAYDERIAAAGRRYGLSGETARRLHALMASPITGRFGKIVREFWIDRVILSLSLTGATVALSLSPAALWVKLVIPLLAFPLVWFLYGWFVGDKNALTTGYETHRHARLIAGLVDSPVIVFGHTHGSEIVPLAKGLDYANSGTWAPSWGPDGALAPGHKNYVAVLCAPGQRPSLEVGSWQALAAPLHESHRVVSFAPTRAGMTVGELT